MAHGMYSIEVGPANGLKQRIQQYIQGIPRETLQLITTAFPSRLQEPIERHDGHVPYKVSFSQSNDPDEVSLT